MTGNEFRKEIKRSCQTKYSGYEKECNDRAEKHFRRHPVTGEEIRVETEDGRKVNDDRK